MGLPSWARAAAAASVLIFVTSGQYLIINSSKMFLRSYSDLRKDSHLNLKKLPPND